MTVDKNINGSQRVFLSLSNWLGIGSLALTVIVLVGTLAWTVHNSVVQVKEDIASLKAHYEATEKRLDEINERLLPYGSIELIYEPLKIASQR